MAGDVRVIFLSFCHWSCGSALSRAIMQVPQWNMCACMCVCVAGGVGTVSRMWSGTRAQREGRGKLDLRYAPPIAYLVASPDPRDDDISCAQLIITLRLDTCVTCTRRRVYVYTRARLIFVFANRLPCRDTFVTFVILGRRNRMAAADMYQVSTYLRGYSDRHRQQQHR